MLKSDAICDLGVLTGGKEDKISKKKRMIIFNKLKNKVPDRCYRDKKCIKKKRETAKKILKHINKEK